jgi:hypothetical protein
MIPEYKRDRKHANVDIQSALEQMPDIADLIAKQSAWDEYEQKPDFSEIPPEFQSMIPENIRKEQEDTRIYNMWLTKQ